jgi:hypothetical protein
MVNAKRSTQVICHKNGLPKVFYKITNKLENHHAFQYKEGLNILKQEFDPKVECGKGGLYCAEKKNIIRWTNLGCHIRKIHIPKDATVVKLKEKYKTDRLILLDKFDLYSVNTIKKLKINISSNKHIYCNKYLKNTTDSLDTQYNFLRKNKSTIDYYHILYMYLNKKDMLTKLLQNKIISQIVIKKAIDEGMYMYTRDENISRVPIRDMFYTFVSFLEEYLVKKVKI